MTSQTVQRERRLSLSLPSPGPPGPANGVEYIGDGMGAAAVDVDGHNGRGSVHAAAVLSAVVPTVTELLNQARARLSSLDEQIARLEELKLERATLIAMVDAAERAAESTHG
jgi:hypothetical protein